MLLLRIGRDKTLWEATNSIEMIIESAFSDEHGKPELAVSVYQIGLHEVVRAFVEHAAAAELNPPNGKPCVDMTNALARVNPDPLPGPFALVRSSHCELIFRDATELTGVLLRIREEVATRLHKVTSADVKAYVRGQLAAGDTEWLAYAATHPKWASL